MFFVFLLVLAACGESNDLVEEKSNQGEEGAEHVTQNSEKEEPEKDAQEEKPEKDKESSDEDIAEELPKIPDEALEVAYSEISKYDLVKDSHIEIDTEKGEITMALIVNASTNKEYAEELGDSFARLLSSFTSTFGDEDLRSPGKDDLGELYEHYDLVVGVGDGYGEYIAMGAKVPTAPSITW
ncbi:hypothetical protein DXT76_13470 [Halobacillus trueperi]|uniref:Uncharacterized protein n=1 Tax=Halobacillus trueperi TaxID=156205 RepID=A0A3D8VLR1_9BACI|nr:hypothetical protein [Halobacillus trueperi]RDY70280.1 hypothetical protein DXT76_13470 [Halobacillus trueperi]